MRNVDREQVMAPGEKESHNTTTNTIVGGETQGFSGGDGSENGGEDTTLDGEDRKNKKKESGKSN